jgi:predicted nucleic acid-binding protein
MTGGGKVQLCFVDSNVWIYAFNAAQDPLKTSEANALIRSIDICLSTQVINEVCYSLIRKASFDETRILNFIEAFYQRYVVVGVRQLKFGQRLCRLMCGGGFAPPCEISSIFRDYAPCVRSSRRRFWGQVSRKVRDFPHIRRQSRKTPNFAWRTLVVELDKHILTSASDLRDRYNFSYWDSLIVSSALAAKADVLYSEDMHHGLIVGSQLEIINPF